MGQKQGKLLLLPSKDEYMKLNKALDKKSESSLILSKAYQLFLNI